MKTKLILTAAQLCVSSLNSLAKRLKVFILIASLLSLSPTEAAAQYPDWQHSGLMFILTTPEGANLPTPFSPS
jgi:hypothetical protein